uniref:Uncharacterized protein n=1 Tax=Brassica oleracea TaxID=3712 RepID=A0A3P6BRJ0_BRAOL|nr:unnamed protein product [Brassica oleracea]
MDLGQSLPILVDVDRFRWTVVETFSSWRQEILLGANQSCIRK